MTKTNETMPTLGRKRNPKLDSAIMQATIDVLSEVGFDGMTMDMVAARAKAGKASLYRRWKSKTELVHDALAWMNRTNFDLDNLPDTGSLRGDFLALHKRLTVEQEQKKLRVLAGLGSFLSQQSDRSENPRIFEAWRTANRTLMTRAVERGEIPINAKIELAINVISSVATFRGIVEHRPVDQKFYTALIDGIILPALKNPPSK